jgi:hypothetical protein
LRRDLNDVLGPARRVRDQWLNLSRRLQEAERAGDLSRWLLEFAQDGGLKRLRELLRSHVQDHGLRQLHEHGVRQAATLDSVIEQLCEALETANPPLQPIAGPTTQVRETIRKLLRAGPYGGHGEDFCLAAIAQSVRSG